MLVSLNTGAGLFAVGCFPPPPMVSVFVSRLVFFSGLCKSPGGFPSFYVCASIPSFLLWLAGSFVWPSVGFFMFNKTVATLQQDGT